MTKQQQASNSAWRKLFVNRLVELIHSMEDEDLAEFRQQPDCRAILFRVVEAAQGAEKQIRAMNTTRRNKKSTIRLNDIPWGNEPYHSGIED